mmetsp:Transcript_23453/g.39780  ORF Transcript_23453/g.39780 Transcript_23453/m.39780 type:complete len:160 (+) Transcript_23453:386-865(+)
MCTLNVIHVCHNEVHTHFHASRSADADSSPALTRTWPWTLTSPPPPLTSYSPTMQCVDSSSFSRTSALTGLLYTSSAPHALKCATSSALVLPVTPTILRVAESNPISLIFCVASGPFSTGISKSISTQPKSLPAADIMSTASCPWQATSTHAPFFVSTR